MRMRRRTQGNSSTRLRLVVDLDRYSISPLLFFFFSFPRAALTRFLPDLSLEMSYLVPCSKGGEGRKEGRKEGRIENGETIDRFVTLIVVGIMYKSVRIARIFFSTAFFPGAILPSFLFQASRRERWRIGKRCSGSTSLKLMILKA